jgi:hypothetical protein
MARKAKGEELNQEQLLEMQALFEGSNYGAVKIADTINERHKVTITEGTVRHYAKKEGWVKGKKKEYYNAKKLAKIEETSIKAKGQKKEYKLITKISEEAQEEGEKVALLTMKSEAFKAEIEHEYAKALMNALKNYNKTQELINGGSVTDKEFEYVGNITDPKTGKVVRGNIVQRTKTLLPKDHIDLLKVGQGLGHLLTPQQQQNTQINIGTQQTKDIINIDSQEIKQGIDKLHDNLVKSIETE